jgi:hypothetical protein
MLLSVHLLFTHFPTSMYITLIATAIAALFASTSAYTIDPRAATKTCRVTPRCPNEDGCMTTAANGAVFQYKCSTDYNGDIIESSQVKSYIACNEEGIALLTERIAGRNLQ